MTTQTLAHRGSAASIVPSRTLVTALRADAAVSGAAALLQLLASGSVAAITGLGAPLLLGSGAFLVAYVALLLVLAAARSVWRPLLWLVIGGNTAWAMGCLVLAETMALPWLGIAYLVAQAAAVLALAAWQALGLRRSAAAQ